MSNSNFQLRLPAEDEVIEEYTLRGLSTYKDIDDDMDETSRNIKLTSNRNEFMETIGEFIDDYSMNKSGNRNISIEQVLTLEKHIKILGHIFLDYKIKNLSKSIKFLKRKLDKLVDDMNNNMRPHIFD